MSLKRVITPIGSLLIMRLRLSHRFMEPKARTVFSRAFWVDGKRALSQFQVKGMNQMLKPKDEQSSVIRVLRIWTTSKAGSMTFAADDFSADDNEMAFFRQVLVETA